ncbi:sigma-54-dependent transcriptional regulator [Singulisphaera acidiphila]|uniref:DNA-binding transcriptional regulator NtrC n=1 Tax=Singulisphaera acidiphila (strain ATCC BAA-1392 / DSM 18658 / VKM B-2454 / MOB10) TaxID=886293 RepID=L0DQH1_SINAD|nr:sigma-54 dependent transcriptional regulator [Singulisphaera acidiphila]AGA31150.1 response regulator with CheY-like receiver, AAA-type ATPase, and DNA-binding domains [Singulisphaera acidiphila DSM 18658]
MGRILIVDDEASICWAFREFLTDEGHEVEIAASAEEGLRLANGGGLDAVVLDVRLPGMDGLTAMTRFRERIGATPIIVITAFGNLDTAVRAIEGGAYDYLVKPFDLDQAGAVIKRALEKGTPSKIRRSEPEPQPGPETLIGASPAMQDLFKSIALVAPTDVPVLITGESGTGKELVARAIHRHSSRHAGPFLPVCLAALSPNLVERELFGHVRGSFTGAVQDQKGLLELAHGGTVLLDEVGDIPTLLQVKLLRAIEHREVTPVGDAKPRATNIRVVAATNRPLAELMATGQFRDDLFFRLSVFPIHLPPLRDRPDDIPVLAEHFLKQSRLPDGTDGHLSREVLAELRSRPWPGNVRELRNAIEHAAIVARGRSIRVEHLPTSHPSATIARPPIGREIQEQATLWAHQEAQSTTGDETPLYERFLTLVEPPLLRVVLERCQGNRAAAAQMLGMHRATLRQRLRKYGVE